MQGDPSTSGYLKTMTTCKHFAGFNLGTTIGQDGKFTQAQTFNALISDQDMADTFLPAFRACITEARGASVMCSCEPGDAVVLPWSS
jgi:beta-glucosidase-like glycosyl hydrolase